MTARKINGAWWVDFRFERKRYRRKSPVNTRRGAEECERTLRVRLVEGPIERKEKKRKRKSISIEKFAKEFMSTYVKSNNKPSEVESKETILRVHLLPFFGRRKLSEIDGRMIEKYKAEKLQKLKPKTINNHLTVLRKMLSLAVEWNLLGHIPAIKWLKTPEPEFDFLDFEEAERLMKAASPEWKTMISTAVKTGMRLGELIALHWDDVDLVAQKIVVRRAVARGIIGTPKSGKSREIALSPNVHKTLTSHRHLKGEFVFCDEKGNMLTKGSTKWPLWSACKKAGLRRIGWHVLRHTFASHLVMRGVPLKAVQELMGHATIEMTMRYAHLSPAIHRQAVAKLDEPVKSGHYLGIDSKTTAQTGSST